MTDKTDLLDIPAITATSDLDTQSEPEIFRNVWGKCVGFDRRVLGRRVRFTICASLEEVNGRFFFKLCANDKCIRRNLVEGRYSVGIEVAGIGIEIVGVISQLSVSANNVSFRLDVDACFNVVADFCADLIDETVRIVKLNAAFQSSDAFLEAGTWVALTPQDLE